MYGNFTLIAIDSNQGTFLKLACPLNRYNRRNSNKGKRWIKKRYFRTIGRRNWVFCGTQKLENGTTRVVDLLYMNTVKIVRHVKIQGAANPYAREWQEYFSKRLNRKRSKVTEQPGLLNAEAGFPRA